MLSIKNASMYHNNSMVILHNTFLAMVAVSSTTYLPTFEQLRRKAESAGGKLIDLHTWSLKMSQYDHATEVCTKKPLSQRWHVLGDGSGVVHRDVYSAFLARCVMSNTHHPSHIETMWAAQKPVLLQTGWLRSEPAKIEPRAKSR